MAYLAFDFETVRATAAAPVEADARIAFSVREWQVIHLARRDGIPRPASRLMHLSRFVFGVRVANPLADARLETLRQAAARLWRGTLGLDPDLTCRLRMQGFSFGQLTLLSSWIDARR